MSEISGTLHPRERVLIPEAPPASGLRECPIAHGSDQDSGSPLLRGAAPFNIAIEIRSDLASAADEWKAFEPHADCTPFQTFGWLEKWQRHIGALKGTVPAVVFGRDEQRRILFILPLAIGRRSVLRALTWLGLELGDYNGPLLANCFFEHPAAKDFSAVWKAVVALLRSDARFRFDLIDLPKMPDTIGMQENPFLRLKILPHRSGAYVATLGRSWDGYYASRRSASTRKTLRRKQKQLEEHGEIRFVEPAASVAAAHTLATLIEQKSRVFARMGVENIFMRPGYRDFYLSLVTDPVVRDFVHVSRLDVGETIAATNLGLQFRGRYYLILSSYHGGEISRFGPGRTHLHELLRRAIERGFTYFDFTIGDEPYKLDWADRQLVLYDHLAAYTARGWLVASAVNFLRAATRLIKTTPVLWHLAVKLRAFAGRFARTRKATVGASE